LLVSFHLEIGLSIKENQRELQRKNVFGIPGIFVSGIVWLIAGLACLFVSENAAIAVLFVGGMAIYPLSTLICQRLVTQEPAETKNPLDLLGLESTALLFAGLFLAYIGRSQSPGYFFNTMLVIIGVRYLVFQTIYGLRHYWVLGLLLAYTGLALFIFQNTWLPAAALAGGVIEIATSVFMWFTLQTRAAIEWSQF
jgi:hypothetical protein